MELLLKLAEQVELIAYELEVFGVQKEAATTGPRGGKIIGETQSGKPIYDTHDHPAHKDFNWIEHSDAMSVHDKKEAKAKKAGDKAASKHHQAQGKGHYDQYVKKWKESGMRGDPPTVRLY